MTPKTRSTKNKEKKTANSTSNEQSSSSNLNPTTTPNYTGTMPAKGSTSKQEYEKLTAKLFNTDPSTVVLQIIPENLQRILETQSHIIRTLDRLSERLDTLEKASNDGQTVTAKQIKAVKDSVDTIRFDQIRTTSPKFPVNTNPQSCSSATPANPTSSNEAVAVVNQSLSIEVAEILMQEKKKSAVKDECQKIKTQISLQWEDSLKLRDKHYRNYIKNERKLALYDEWVNLSPDYIPFKFRPKSIPGETEEYSSARIQESRLRYENDRKLLKSYATVHQRKYEEEDRKIVELITTLVSTDDQMHLMTELWSDETKKGELKANQLWSRNEAFLRRKKHEDELLNETVLTDITWEEKLRSYKRKKKRVETGRHETHREYERYYQSPNLPLYQRYGQVFY